MKKNTVIILGFPGTGKSRCTKNTKYDVSDSDSSMFSWQFDRGKERHPEWPSNYKEHIKSLIGKKDVIFVSTHQEVRDMLGSDKDLERRCFTVIPAGDRFEEFISNYKERGNDERFLDLMRDKWKVFREDSFENGVGVRKILGKGSFIDDAFIADLLRGEM